MLSSYVISRPTTLHLAVLSVFLGMGNMAYANTTKNPSTPHPDDEPHVVLESETIKIVRKLGRKSTEVTGLGKIVKSTDDINKEQIMGIRDLTRYDPGIAVVEQGRGASSGYSIRGVDKNRVGLQVDGIVQVQSYINDLSNKANGGAINEIEYENVRSIELSKGSASSEFGSGALGGAVSFRTKDVGDIIKDGKDWGISTKSAYSSKNNQFANTVGLAGRAGGFEALIQYTHRTGEETKVHKDVADLPQSLTRVGAFTDLYELRGSPWNNTGDTEIVNNHNWFILENECPTRDCTPKMLAKHTLDNPHTMRTDPPYTPAEQEAYDKMKHITETVSASDYTGANRIMANPMDYESKSYLAKVGYRFNDTHYVGGVFENTKQEYDIQDMSQEAYITPAFLKKYMSGTPAIRGVYYGDNLLSGLVVPIAPHNLSLGYTRGFYFDEHHDKNRHGINYHYTPKAHAWIDDLRLSYDRQSIKLDTLRRETSCAVYPTFDENCRADITKPLSGYLSERNTYKEQHDVLQLSAQKSFKLANTEHRVNVLMGMDKFDSALRRGDWFSEQAQTKVTNLGGKGTKDDPYIYQFEPTTIHTEHFCKDGFSTQDCTDRNITGYNHFFAIRDHIQLGDKVDLGLGVRYDRHKFDSDDDFTATGKYSNWSWNTGLTFHATDNIALSYRRSNGFRVPAFYELYGTRGAYDGSNAVSVARQYISQLDPETSSNQEFGIGLTGNFGYLEVSHFDNKYRNLITVGEKIGNGSERNDGYHNLQDIRLSGINVLGKIDWYGVWDKLPDGLYTTLAYNKITPKELSIKEGYTKVRTPILDTLQPARYVAGLGYDSPDDKWGVNLMATYSKAKNADELQGVSTFGIDRAIVATQGATKRWYTYDLSGHYHVNDSMTLRAGVYNLFNRKYSTWESVRQSSINAVNPTTGNTARYAAPGRNFNVALEFKF